MLTLLKWDSYQKVCRKSSPVAFCRVTEMAFVSSSHFFKTSWKQHPLNANASEVIPLKRLRLPCAKKRTFNNLTHEKKKVQSFLAKKHVFWLPFFRKLKNFFLKLKRNQHTLFFSTKEIKGGAIGGKLFIGGAIGALPKNGCHPIWLVVSTHFKDISQNGTLPQIGVKIKNIWNHHLVMMIPVKPVKKPPTWRIGKTGLGCKWFFPTMVIVGKSPIRIG